MVFYVNSEHPKVTLLFYLAGPVDELAAERIGRLLNELVEQAEWVIGPPMMVHQTEDVLDPASGEPVVTLGGVHRMYSAHGAWRDRIPREVDRAHFEECARIVQGLESLSREYGYEFHFEFEGQLVGRIVNGSADETLGEQFLGSWKMGLGGPA